MIKDPVDYAHQLIAACGGDVAAAKRMCRDAIGQHASVPLEFWLDVGAELLRVAALPPSTPTTPSIDYSELTLAEVREGLGVAAGQDLPQPQGTNADGDAYWDNNFGGFYQRPNGTFYYN